jgi:hypothetical protein
MPEVRRRFVNTAKVLLGVFPNIKEIHPMNNFPDCDILTKETL